MAKSRAIKSKDIISWFRSSKLLSRKVVPMSILTFNNTGLYN